MAVVLLCVVLGIAVIWLGKVRVDLLALRQRFAPIVQADAEAARIVDVARQKLVEAELTSSRLLAEAQVSLKRVQEANAAELQRHAALAAEYATAASKHQQLARELRQLEENLEDISFGLYKPHYEFGTPEEYKRELERVVDRQKDMVRADRAAIFAVAWTVGGSEREGARMQKQYSKLMLRAFNGECDAAIAKVAWNNAVKMEERIQKAFEGINKLGETMQISISQDYRELKLAELRLEHEMEENKRAIAEEQRRIREQMRDEERAQREAEKAQAEAEADETRYEKALDKARVELAKARGEEHARLNAKLAELEQQLAEAHAKSVRAKSMAELTKAGYVYVISNIGSFGDSVFKIGMTRRLEPMDRVKELGDASVPFPFDVHAMIYTTDAPSLENELHRRFAPRSVNLVNTRKEFFRVDLRELEQAIVEQGLKVSFTKVAEAREYRETIEMQRNRDSSRGASRPALFDAGAHLA